MAKEQLNVEDLFPTAQALFRPNSNGARKRLRTVAWIALIISALVIGGRLRARRKRMSE